MHNANRDARERALAAVYARLLRLAAEREQRARQERQRAEEQGGSDHDRR